MSEAQLRAQVLAILGDLAPEADLSALPPNADLQQHLDLDSFDFLTFVTRLHERLGVEVPERDYGQLRTLAGGVAYLERAGGASPPGRRTQR